MDRRNFLVWIAMTGVGMRVPRAWAQSSADYLQLLRTQRGYLEAMVMEKLFTFNVTPGTWQHLTEDMAGTGHILQNLAGALITLAFNMGWGDLVSTDKNGGYDGSSPLLAPMVDGWKGKLACNFTCGDLDANGLQGFFNNVDTLGAPISTTYFCKPRAGRFLLSVTASPTAAALAFKLSADAASYSFTLPAFQSISQSAVEEDLKKGL